ncbi:MAG: metal ABC transporter permease [Odoribacteraceae bacterium]|jgi:zinc transport system permease protein|nr:metal ABC transporter permease [Odoribacteraceae bacterium]
MQDLLAYDFFRNALWSTLLVGIACGLTGTYIVARRMVFISGGITHASFGGLGLAYFLGLSPMLGAGAFALLAAFCILRLSAGRHFKEDSLIGIFWSAGMAAGVLFIYLTPGYAPNLLSYLFGNILTVTDGQVWLSLAFCALIVLFFARYHRPLFYIAFDRDFCLAQHLPVARLETAITILVALCIVLCMKLAGIILVISYMTVPPAIAGLFHKDFKRQLLLSSAVSCIGSVGGLLLSALLDLPSGATIVCGFLAILVTCRAGKYIATRARRENPGGWPGWPDLHNRGSTTHGKTASYTSA